MKPQKIHMMTWIIVFLIVSCSSPKMTSESKTPDPLLSIEGSWALQDYIPDNSENREWTNYGQEIIYEKHLTKDHFVWYKFDKKREVLLGMGGGTYKVSNGQYVEDIQFFYPPGSSELGQSIPFDLKITDGIWMHKGYAKEYEFDPESGDFIVVDSSKIEERWIPTNSSINQENVVMGTWDLDSYLDDKQGDFIEYPKYVEYIKLITPTHFTWIYFNNEKDEIYAAGSGTYTFNNGTYSETIKMIHPSNSGQLGETISFNSKLNNKKWKHSGYIPTIYIDETNGDIVKDSTFIDEIWILHKDMIVSSN